MAAEKKKPDYRAKFDALVAQDIDAQVEAFLKSFIFDLGDKWQELVQLQKDFVKQISDSDEPGEQSLGPVAAAHFLQQHGAERTATERKEEVSDIDIDQDGRIAFIEMCFLLKKTMILKAYYKRHELECPFNLEKGGIGIVGVGEQLLEELFTAPEGMSPELEAALEEFAETQRKRNARVKELNEKVALGGVKGLTAKNELAQMEQEDTTAMNRLEITLKAAQRKAAKSSGSEALARKQKEEEDAKKAALEAGRNKMKARAALWENK